MLRGLAAPRVGIVGIRDISQSADALTAIVPVADGHTAAIRHPSRIHRLARARHVRPCPDALRALINADVVVVGPGSLYTNVLPNLLVEGIAATLSAVRSTRIYVASLMTQPGETQGMSLDDHLRALREHTGYELFDYVLVNQTPPTPKQLESHRNVGAQFIACDRMPIELGRAQLVATDLLDRYEGDVRHDGAKLAAAILQIAGRRRLSSASAARPS